MQYALLFLEIHVFFSACKLQLLHFTYLTVKSKQWGHQSNLREDKQMTSNTGKYQPTFGLIDRSIQTKADTVLHNTIIIFQDGLNCWPNNIQDNSMYCSNKVPEDVQTSKKQLILYQKLIIQSLTCFYGFRKSSTHIFIQ